MIFNIDDIKNKKIKDLTDVFLESINKKSKREKTDSDTKTNIELLTNAPFFKKLVLWKPQLYFNFKMQYKNSIEFDILWILNSKSSTKKNYVIIFEGKDYRNKPLEFPSSATISKKEDEAKDFCKTTLNDYSLIFIFGWIDSKNVFYYEGEEALNTSDNINWMGYSGCKEIENLLNDRLSDAKPLSSNLGLDEYPKKDKDLFNEIWRLCKDNEYLYINGSPGSGKTFNAIHLVKQLEDSGKKVIFHFINEKMVNIWKGKNENGEGGNYPSVFNSTIPKNTFSKTAQIKEEINNNKYDYLIIDEAQRVASCLLKKCIEKGIKIVLFGDIKQKLNSDDKFNHIDFFKKIGKKFENLDLKHSLRFTNETLSWINYFCEGIKKPGARSQRFKIEILNSKSQFIEEYEKEKKNKFLASFPQKGKSDDLPYHPIYPRNNKNYSSWNKYISNAYFLISDEVDFIYIYLPDFFLKKEKIVDSEKRKITPPYNEDVDLEGNFYILMTRATKKIVFFAENKQTEKYLEKKCSEYLECKNFKD